MLRPRLSLALIAAISTVAPAQNADDAAYRAATGLLHRDMPADAAAEYRAFLRDNPSHEKADSARYGLAVCLSRLGKWADAAAELDALSGRSFEFAPDALLLQSQCLMNIKDNAGAIRSLQALLKDHPTFAQRDSAAGLLGEALVREGEPQRAREVLGRFEREWPKSAARPRVELLLATLDAAEGKDQSAADRLARLRKDNPGSDIDQQAALAEAQCRHRLAASGDRTQGERAAALYRAITERGDSPLAPSAMLGLAQITRASGDPVKAGRMLDDLLTRFPESAEVYAAHIERARALLDENRAEHALEALKPVLSQGLPDAVYWAAKAELRLQRFTSAADRLGRAARSHGDSPLLPEILFDRAVALARDGQLPAAAVAYAEVRNRFPQHPLSAEALSAQASLALSAGEHARAAALCREFLSEYPGHPRAASVQLTHAEAAAMAGNNTESASLYESFLAANAEDPRATDVAVRRGLALARSGKAEESTRILEAALTAPGQIDEPLRAAALTVLADAAISRSDWASAEKHLRSARTSSPDSTLKLAIALQRQGKTDESLTLLNSVASSSDGPAVQARFERAQILIERNQLDNAKADFESVINAEQNQAERRFTVHALRHLASIAAKQGRADEAARLLAQVADSPEAGSVAADALYDQGAALLASGQYQDALTALERFITSSPSHPRAADAAAQRAIALARLGRHERALSLMDEAESRASDIRPEVLSALWYERAWTLKSVSRDAEARAVYERLLAATPTPTLESHAALDLGQLLVNAGEHAKALPVLSRALAAAARAPEPARVSPHALYLRAVCELKLDKPADSASTLEELLTKYADTDLAPAAQLLCGQALLKANKPEAAASRLESAIAARPQAESLAPALLCLGEAHALSQNWDKSRSAFERHLKDFPESEFWFQSRFGIGWSLEHEGRHAEAITAYRDVVARHTGPTAARAQFQIGECLFAQRQYEEAARELLKVDILYSYPEWSAAALYEAGRCQMQLNKTTEARTQFSQVIDRFKDTQWARLAAEQTQKLGAAATLPGHSDTR